MKIYVSVKPNAKKNEVERLDGSHYKVFVKAPPKDGKANDAVVEVLKEHFRLPRSSISIVSGLSSKQKTVEIKF